MRNVVLVCLDCVRKDAYDRHAPRLQERAAVDFDGCRAASSWSVPSHASLFTGELPHRHGIHAANRDFSGLDRDDTFLGRLPDHEALGASANVWASSAFGFDGLFDDFAEVSPDRRFPGGIDVARFGQECEATGLRKHAAFLRAAATHDRPLRSLANGAAVELDRLLSRAPFAKPFDDGASVVTRAARELVDDTDEPFVLFANLMDAHGPLTPVRGYDSDRYDVPAGWTSDDVDWTAALDADDTTELDRYRGLYGAAIEYLDRQVCDLLDAIQASTDRETVAVVTADHGDGLGLDPDEPWGHVTSSLAEGLLHVPCTVVGASAVADGIDPDGLVSQCDLVDLLVALGRGEELPEVTRDAVAAERLGHSGRIGGEAPDPANDRAVRAVYDGGPDGTKYRWDSAGDRDRFRMDPNRPSRAERVDDAVPVDDLEPRFFDDTIDAWHAAAADGSTPDVDDATAARLEHLGYR